MEDRNGHNADKGAGLPASRSSAATPSNRGSSAKTSSSGRDGVPPRVDDYEEDDDTVIDLKTIAQQKKGAVTSGNVSGPPNSGSDLHGFEESDDEEETLLLPQKGTNRVSSPHPVAKGSARSISVSTARFTQGSEKSSTPRKLSELAPAGSDDDDMTVSHPKVHRQILKVDKGKELANRNEPDSDPFGDSAQPPGHQPPEGGTPRQDRGHDAGFDDGPTTPALHSPADDAFDSISKTEVAGPSQTHSLESDDATPNYSEPDPVGLLIIHAPENGKVYIDGKYQGEGRIVVSDADTFALYHIRIHCAGFRPWNGTGCLHGKASLELKPELQPRS
jgi:hypothetical protein